MPIIGKFPDGRLLVREAQAGPNPYDATAPPTILFNDLQQNVEAVLSVQIDGAGNSFIAVPAGITGRTLTVRVLGQTTTPTNGTAFRELLAADAVNLSARTFTAVAVGT